MGNRIVLTLLTDLAHEWEKEPELGKLIMSAAQSGARQEVRGSDLQRYGFIVELEHGDTQSLVLFDHYNGRPIGYGSYNRGKTETPEEVELKLLRDAADRLGFSLRRKPKQ